MFSLLLSALGTLFIVVIIIPLKVLVKIMMKIDTSRAKKQREKMDEQLQISIEDAKSASEDGMTGQARFIKAKTTAKKRILETSIKMRRSTLKLIHTVLSFFQVTSIASALIGSIIIGLLVFTAYNMSTLIPVWELDRATTDSSGSYLVEDVEEEATDDGGDSGSTSIDGAPNDAVAAFRYLNESLGNKIWASAFVGNMMAETGGGTYDFDPSYDGGTINVGIIQWGSGREVALKQKKNWKTMQVQLDYIMEELNGGENAVYTYIKANPDISLADATRYVATNYERCNAAYVEKRIPMSQQFYDEWVKTGKYK